MARCNQAYVAPTLAKTLAATEHRRCAAHTLALHAT